MTFEETKREMKLQCKIAKFRRKVRHSLGAAVRNLQLSSRLCNRTGKTLLLGIVIPPTAVTGEPRKLWLQSFREIQSVENLNALAA